jgi:enoyl-CoA hydratase/carnithine racemase
MALLARNYEPAEALAAGLVDQLAGADAVESTAESLLRELLDCEPAALSLTKSWLRAPVIEAMRQSGLAERQQFAECWFSPGTQARMRAILAGLKK